MLVRPTPGALADLDAIHEYIGQFDLAAADRMIDRIIAATARLADFPESGTPKPYINPVARSLPIGRYVVLYRVVGDVVEVVSVTHMSRNLDAASTAFD